LHNVIQKAKKHQSRSQP